MGFFKRAGATSGGKRGRRLAGKSNSTAAKKSKFEPKKETRKSKALDEEISSSSDEEEIHEGEIHGHRKSDENIADGGDQEYEDDRTLADREALRLLEATKETAAKLLDEGEEGEGEKEKEEAANARAHRPEADQIRLGQQLTCKPHRLSPVCLCFSRNCDFLVSCAKDGSLIKYDLKKRCRVGILRAETKKTKNMPKNKGKKRSMKKYCTNFHKGQILCCAISPDDRYLVTGGTDCLIKIWSFDTLEFLQDFDGHRRPITSIRFRQQCEALEMFSASRDRSIMVWNLDEMGLVNTLYGHQDAVEQLDILQWPRLVSCGGMDKSCRLFKILEDSHLVFNGFAECVSIDCIALINEEHFVSGSVDGSLYIWSVARKKPICVRRNAHGFNNPPMVVNNPMEKTTMTEKNQQIGQQKAGNEPRWICAVAALPYTDLVASGSSDGFLRLWRVSQDWKTIDQVQQIRMPGFINDIRFSRDGHLIGCAVGQEHKRGRWWTFKGDDINGMKDQKVQNRLVVISLNNAKSADELNANCEGGSGDGETMEISSSPPPSG